MNNSEKLMYEFVLRGDLEIDDQGRMWRVRSRGKSVPRRRAEQCNTNGYFTLNTKVNGKTINANVHRLVWLHFYGEIPNGLTINHKNGNKHDNRLENLELWSHVDNGKHSAFVLNNIPAKLTEQQVREIKALLNSKVLTQRAIAKIYGISKSVISGICLGTRWSHVK